MRSVGNVTEAEGRRVTLKYVERFGKAPCRRRLQLGSAGMQELSGQPGEEQDLQVEEAMSIKGYRWEESLEVG